MKSLLTSLMALSLLFASVIPVWSQRGTRSDNKEVKELVTTRSNELTARFGKVYAVSYGSLVNIAWEMEQERGVLGFNVYRESSYGPIRINDQMISGSALLFGRETSAGTKYEAEDERPREGSFYRIEAITLDGRSIFSEAVWSVRTDEGLQKTEDKASTRRPDGFFRGSDLDLPQEVLDEIDTSQTTTDPDTHRWVISRPGVKIGVRGEGLVRVTRGQLQAGGFDVNSDPAFWQLYLRGVEQAIVVGPAGDFIEFYGKGVDTPESDIGTYFLVSGTNAGKRMATRSSRPSSGAVVSPNYSQKFVLKERTNYTNQIRNGDAENFWGRIVTNTGTTLNFNLTGVDQNRPEAEITIRFQGFSINNHAVQLTLNGTPLNPATGAGQIPFAMTQTVPTSLLNEGINQLHMASSAAGDTNFFDAVEVTFDRRHVAQQGKLGFYTLNRRSAHVRGFPSANVRVFDTTNTSRVEEVLGTSVVAAGDGTFTLLLTGARPRTVYAVNEDSLLSPFSVAPINPENLAEPTNGAQLVIIAHHDLMTQAEAWATYRRNQGFSVEVVDVRDIYDEFNYGILNADSIKSFLNYAHMNWQTPPQYVLLVGDASFDSRNYLGTGYFNMVPTRIINTIFTETGSDEFLADFNNDGLASISIGRIPARTPDRVNRALAKVVNWEANLNDPLDRGSLFAYDLPDGYDFEAMSHRMRNQLPGTMAAAFVGRGQANSQANVVAAINSGKFVVNYSGHGTTGVWASTGFFGISNVTCTGGQTHCVNNPNNESLFTMLTCLNGFFLNLTADSLAESLLFTENGGAVAAWASTGLTTPDIQEIMGQRFYNQLGVGDIPRLGDLIKDAKTQIPGGMDVRLSWALIGDPMLRTR